MSERYLFNLMEFKLPFFNIRVKINEKFLFNLFGFSSFELKMPYILRAFWQTKKMQVSDNGVLNINFQHEEMREYSSIRRADILPIVTIMTYSITLFGFLCIQPIYLIHKLIINNENTKQNVGLLCLYSIVPLNYLWAKYYLTTDHFYNYYYNSVKINYHAYFNYKYMVFFCSILSAIYIIIAICIMGNQLKNSSYWCSDKSYFWTVYILTEFFSKLLIIHNYLICLLIFYDHSKEMTKYIKKLESNKIIVLDNTSVINKFIFDLTRIKGGLECSIYYFNPLMACTTILVGIASLMFFEVLTNSNEKIIDSIYTWSLLGFGILIQGIFFIIMYVYTTNRSNIYQAIVSHQFLFKYILTKNHHMSSEENRTSTILGWLILKKTLEEKWLDFKVLGVSSHDGDLLKKSITIGIILISIFSFI